MGFVQEVGICPVLVDQAEGAFPVVEDLPAEQMPADAPDVFALAPLQVVVPGHQIVQIAHFEGDVLDPNAFVQGKLKPDYMVVHELIGAIEPGKDHLR